MSLSSSNAQDVKLRTCDACKFRHQHCDSVKPICGSCRSRRLKCAYTRTSASAVQRPKSRRYRSETSVAFSEESTGSDLRRSPSSTICDGDGHLTTSRDESALSQTHQKTSNRKISEQPPRSIQTISSLLGTRIEWDSLCGSLRAYVEAVVKPNQPSYSPLDSPTPIFQDSVTRDEFTGFHGVAGFNPFSAHAVPETERLLANFSSIVNSLFCLFKRGELEQLFDAAVATKSSLSNSAMSQLYFALALGAQVTSLEDTEKLTVCYENGRRCLDGANWKEELWVMRAVTLMCIYHIGERQETASYYLSIAVRIGQANLLDQNIPYHELDGETYQWHRVWHTIVFLNKWLRSSGSSNFNNLTGLESILCRTQPSAFEQLSTIDGPEQIAQTILTRLGNIFHGITQNIYSSVVVPMSAYEMYLAELQMVMVGTPAQLHYSADGDMSKMSKERISILLHLHTLRLGSIVILARPMLLETLDARSEQVLEFGIQEFAYICIKYASDLISLCERAFQAEGFPSRAWLPIYFLFDAALISLLGVVWQRKLEAISPAFLLSHHHLYRSRLSLDMATRILEYCARTNEAARQSWEHLAYFRQCIES